MLSADPVSRYQLYMANDDERWIPASQAMRGVTSRISAEFGIEKGDAWREAANAILERLSAGTLRATPKGFLPGVVIEEKRISYWFEFSETEDDGRKFCHPPSWDFDFDANCIPREFWIAFKRSPETARADWASGDFYIGEYEDRHGVSSGIARDVWFIRDELPGSDLILGAHAEPASERVQQPDPPKNKAII